MGSGFDVSSANGEHEFAFSRIAAVDGELTGVIWHAAVANECGSMGLGWPDLICSARIENQAKIELLGKLGAV